MLVDAADELLGEGARLSLAEVAMRAGVSRATAYRYFPSIEPLLVELSLRGASGTLAGVDFDALASLALPDAAERLVRHMANWAFDHETALRLSLHASVLPNAPTVRPAHRRSWIGRLLAPYRARISPSDYERLCGALTLLFGADAVVCLRDIAGLDRDSAIETLAWTARRLTTDLT